MIRMTSEKPLLVVLTGPTASGKTGISIKLAQTFHTDILSCDSRQFYREMKIGTAAPCRNDLEAVHHHFIGHLSVLDDYNVSKYESDALQLLGRIFEKQAIVLMVGGSGLYIDAVTRGFDDLPDGDPEIRMELKERLLSKGIESLRYELRKIDPRFTESADMANPIRLIRAIEVFRITGKPFSTFRGTRKSERPFRVLKLALKTEREILYGRINHRVEEMIEQGLLDEVKSLYNYQHLNALNTVGYKELFHYLENRCTLDAAIEKIKVNTRRYAKRQITWFSRDKEINWFTDQELDQMILKIKDYS